MYLVAVVYFSPVAEAVDELPVIRDYDAHTFILTRNHQFVVGGFERDAKPAFPNGIPPNWRQSLVGDDDHFRKYLLEKHLSFCRDILYNIIMFGSCVTEFCTLFFTGPIREAAEHRLPILKRTLYQPLVNAPDNFTPDGKWILGETPEVHIRIQDAELLLTVLYKALKIKA